MHANPPASRSRAIWPLLVLIVLAAIGWLLVSRADAATPSYRLLYRDGDGAIWLQEVSDLAVEPARWPAPQPLAGAGWVSWSPDGRQLLFDADRLMDLPAGACEQVRLAGVPPDSARPDRSLWLPPDGLVFFSANGPGLWLAQPAPTTVPSTSSGCAGIAGKLPSDLRRSAADPNRMTPASATPRNPSSQPISEAPMALPITVTVLSRDAVLGDRPRGAPSPGGQLAFWREEPDLGPVVFAKDLTFGDEAPLFLAKDVPAPAKAVDDLAWRPGSQAVAFTWLLEERSLVLIGEPGAVPARVLTPDAGDWSHPAWSPDGSRLALARVLSDTVTISLLNPDAAPESARALVDLPAGDRLTSGLVWTPDGLGLAWSAGTDGAASTLYVAPVDGRAPVTLPGRQPIGFLP